MVGGAAEVFRQNSDAARAGVVDEPAVAVSVDREVGPGLERQWSHPAHAEHGGGVDGGLVNGKCVVALGWRVKEPVVMPI